jgi:anion-transporting  ArsA/GET3 family ATPase
MMLDMKRTFDDLVEAAASPEKAAQIRANPFYEAMSSSFSGTQEYMAMEKLSQLRAQAAAGERPWDLIVVDTPPSRSALDFLDAPRRLSSFLDGRFIRVLMAPAKAGGRAYLRVFSAAVGGVADVMTRLLGAEVLRDAQTFVAALDTIFGGFRQRAEATYAMLQAPGTSFLVVAAPDPDSLREASYFVERLSQDRMPMAGMVLNRVHTSAIAELTGERSTAAAEQLAEDDVHPLTAGLLRLHAARMQRRDAEQQVARRMRAAHPDLPVVEVPVRAEDVHDLPGLRSVGEDLGA